MSLAACVCDVLALPASAVVAASAVAVASSMPSPILFSSAAVIGVPPAAAVGERRLRVGHQPPAEG
jgi:hypothetical protein